MKINEDFIVGRYKAESLNLPFDKYGYNKIRFGKRETLKHKMIKALIFSILRERGRIVFTEYQLSDKVKVDVFDLDKRYVYEVENNPKAFSRKKRELLMTDPRVADFIIIDLRKMPDNIHEAYIQLVKTIL